MTTSLDELHLLNFFSSNIDDLANTSSHFTQLIHKLLSLGILTADDCEELELPGISKYKRFADLYAEIPKKGELGYNSLIIALITTRNSTPVKLLTGKTIDELEDEGIHQFIKPTDFKVKIAKKEGGVLNVESISLNKKKVASIEETQDNSDFALNKPQLQAIQDILIQDNDILKSWNETKNTFLSSPKVSQKDKDEIEKLTRKDVIKGIDKTLNKWQACNGNKATFDTCVAIIKENNFDDVAGRLEKAKNYIRSLKHDNDESSETKPLLKGSADTQTLVTVGVAGVAVGSLLSGNRQGQTTTTTIINQPVTTTRSPIPEEYQPLTESQSTSEQSPVYRSTVRREDHKEEDPDNETSKPAWLDAYCPCLSCIPWKLCCSE